MRAMVLRGTTLAIEEVPRPAPGTGQLLARVLACGICGSDLHAARHIDAMTAAAGGPGLANAGIVMGHEFVAEVVEAGPGVEGFAPGDRVTSMPVLVDPASGRVLALGYNPAAPGAYAEYLLLTAALCLPVPAALESAVAATTEPCAVGLHAVRESRIQPGEPALVMGAGPIGLMTLLWLRDAGVRFIAVSDPAPERRALARALGATAVFDPTEGMLATALADALPAPEAAGGLPAGYMSEGGTAAPPVVFECVGVPGTLQQAMQLVQPKGRVVVVGVCMEPDRITPSLGVTKQLTLQFVLGYTAAEYAEALDAIAGGRVDTRPLVTRTVGLDELPAAFAALAGPRDCKVVYVAG
ncbi:MAG: zinc-binding dehydrogenase [Dehalococcoidia bacterium]